MQRCRWHRANPAANASHAERPAIDCKCNTAAAFRHRDPAPQRRPWLPRIHPDASLAEGLTMKVRNFKTVVAAAMLAASLSAISNGDSRGNGLKLGLGA